MNTTIWLSLVKLVVAVSFATVAITLFLMACYIIKNRHVFDRNRQKVLRGQMLTKEDLDELLR